MYLILSLTRSLFELCSSVGLSIIHLVVAVCAVVALIFAKKSFDIAKKTRRDMFLPIVVAKDYSSQPSAGFILFYLQNVGHGIALEPRVYLIDAKGREVHEAHHTKGERIPNKEKIEFVDYRVPQEWLIGHLRGSRITSLDNRYACVRYQTSGSVLLGETLVKSSIQGSERAFCNNNILRR